MHSIHAAITAQTNHPLTFPLLMVAAYCTHLYTTISGQIILTAFRKHLKTYLFRCHYLALFYFLMYFIIIIIIISLIHYLLKLNFLTGLCIALLTFLQCLFSCEVLWLVYYHFKGAIKVLVLLLLSQVTWRSLFLTLNGSSCWRMRSGWYRTLTTWSWDWNHSNRRSSNNASSRSHWPPNRDR